MRCCAAMNSTRTTTASTRRVVALVVVVGLLCMGGEASLPRSLNNSSISNAGNGFKGVSQYPSHTLVPGIPIVIHNATGETFPTFMFTSAPNTNLLARIRSSIPALDVAGSFQPNALDQSGDSLGVYISQPCGFKTWALPLVLSHGTSQCVYNTIARDVCPMVGCAESQNISFGVTVSSLSPQPFTLEVELVDPYVHVDQPKHVEVAPNTPSYLRFKLAPGTRYSVHATSNNTNVTCIVSIQNSDCPIYDLPSNIKFEGLYQSATEQAVFVIGEDMFAGGAEDVVIVLIMTPDDQCTTESKGFTVLVQELEENRSYTWPCLFVVTVFFVIPYLLFYLTKCCRKQHASPPDPATIAEVQPLTATPSTNSTSDTYQDKYGGTGDEARDKPSASLEAISSTPETPLESSSAMGNRQFEFHKMHYDPLHARMRWMKPDLRITDLSQKPSWYQARKFGNHPKYLLILVVFYVLPVSQLVYVQLKDFNEGNQDLCFYNFLCSRPLWRFFSFNSIFSNFGYITLGILFVLVVNRQSYDLPTTRHGIPRHRGLFRAIGFAIAAEGIFSACYHVCPSTVNFQFDVSFMYIISTLMLLALYTRRHSDIQPHAHVVYGWIALLIFLVVIGVYNANRAFYAVILVLSIPISMLASLQVYYLGMWGLFPSKDTKEYIGEHDDSLSCFLCEPGVLSKLFQCKARRRNRLLLLLAMNGMTWLIIILALIENVQDVPTVFLALSIVNLLIYLVYYMVMKARCKERFTVGPIIMAVLSFVLWIVAGVLFISKSTNSLLDAAHSRALNQECVFLDFFDTHDLWHMFSAFGLFCSAWLLLVLDNDIDPSIERAQLNVF
eukprot:m.101624 g.101624  ORF g.101624 m.101624 type:complete len:839 (-) comp13206_c0_seq6:1551-4067(-)